MSVWNAVIDILQQWLQQMTDTDNIDPDDDKIEELLNNDWG